MWLTFLNIFRLSIKALLSIMDFLSKERLLKAGRMEKERDDLLRVQKGLHAQDKVITDNDYRDRVRKQFDKIK